MIRTLLLAALVAFVASQEAVDQAEYYGPRMGYGPFCDSDCLPHGDWQLRRDWFSLESSNEDKFLWWADGSQEFWNSGCGNTVNDLIFAGVENDEDDLLDCRPGIIYFFEYVVDYNHEKGRLTEELYLDNAFEVTEDSWAEFVRDYFDVPEARRTEPWSLIRMVPSTSGASRTSRYNNRVSLKQVYVANYERNFCTFVGSNLPISDVATCDFDDDFDSDEETYITRDFCNYLLGRFNDVDLRPDECGDSDDEDCERLRVVYDTRRSPMVPARQLRETMMSVRANGRVQQTTRGEAKKRGQYDFTEQPIPGFGPYGFGTDPFYWSEAWDDNVFYYVPYTSSVTAPYCGYRD